MLHVKIDRDIRQITVIDNGYLSYVFPPEHFSTGDGILATVIPGKETMELEVNTNNHTEVSTIPVDAYSLRMDLDEHIHIARKPPIF